MPERIRLDAAALGPEVAHPRQRVESPYRHLLQDNICTFGYTTAFNGWPEWERYLDVMALHGYNLTMAPLGGEAIWADELARLAKTIPYEILTSIHAGTERIFLDTAP